LRNKSYYAKVDILDYNGNELFAVLFDDRTPYLLSSEHLADKPFWFYLYATEDMKPGESLILPSEIKHPEKAEVIQTISLIMPLFNPKNELISILIGHIDFQEFINLFQIPRRIAGGNVVIVNAEGHYIFNSRESDWNKMLANRENENLLKEYSQQIADIILAGGKGTITEDKQRIIEYASIFSRNAGESWHYIIFIDVATEVIFSKVYRFQKLFILLVSIFGLISVMVGYLAARHYLQPIKHIITGAKNVKDGNLDYEFSSKTRDEIQILVESFNLLIKKARKALKESEERFTQIFKQSEYAIILFNPKNNKIIDANPAAFDLYGYKENELVDKDVSLIFKPASYQEFKNVIASQKKKSNFHLEQLDNQKKDGTSIKVGIRGKIIRLKNMNVVYCDFRDLSGENQMKEETRLLQEKLIQMDKMASLGTMASGVAHEINNPNNSIMLNAAALSEIWENLAPIIDKYHKENQDFTVKGIKYSDISEKIPSLFHGLSDATRRIKNISSNLKDFARQEQDGFKKTVDINEVIETSLSLVNNLILKSTKHFSVSYGNNLPQVKANFQKLEQVIINLLQNACEALSDPSKTIDLSTSYVKSANQVEVKVKDEGCGIPKEILDHITDPFFTTKRSIGGTGLGLSIVSSIIRDHKGTLDFDSKPSQGTAVTIRFPVK
jgi:PAS domain S-box-containing protein